MMFHHYALWSGSQSGLAMRCRDLVNTQLSSSNEGVKSRRKSPDMETLTLVNDKGNNCLTSLHLATLDVKTTYLWRYKMESRCYEGAHFFYYQIWLGAAWKLFSVWPGFSNGVGWGSEHNTFSLIKAVAGQSRQRNFSQPGNPRINGLFLTWTSPY